MNINSFIKNINKTDYLFSIFLTLVFAAGLALLLYVSNMQIMIIAGLSALVFIIILFFKQNSRKILKHITDSNNNTYKQIQAYISLHEKIQPGKALFPMQGSAILPDLGNILINYIDEIKPELIVECGSGVSTLISAYCLKRNKKGLIKTLDHEKKYLEITQNSIESHGLSKFVDFIHAPVKDYELNNQNHKFYDISALENENEIDILFIDGPPRNIKKNIRFASLPLLISKIRKGGIIILDDANRKAEKEAVKIWIKEFPDLEYTYIPTAKGTVILKKQY